jgi:hypothetical protein
MARQRKATKSSGGRGSAEAIEKRRVARQLNSLLTGGSKIRSKIDGRTEKRRQRLVQELVEGKGGKPLKPNDAVDHTNELLSLGETMASLKKQGVKPRRTPLTPDVVETVERAQQAYSFNPEAWQILGIHVTLDGQVLAQEEEAPAAASAQAAPAKRRVVRRRKKA